MKKKIKKNGDIFIIDLNPIFPLYAYAQYINMAKYVDNVQYPDLMIVYNYFVSTPNENILNKVYDLDYLINPVYVSGGNGIAKMFDNVGHINPDENKLIIPPIRHSVKVFAKDNELEIIPWDVIKPDGQKINLKPMNYSEVVHLDPPGAIINIGYLSFRISLAYCKLISLNLPTNLHLDWYHKLIIRATSDIPLWKDIPKHKRSKL